MDEKKDDSPYIAAKFLHQSIPYSFSLGDEKIYEGFTNRRLMKDTETKFFQRYRIFVRAVVDSPGLVRNLYVFQIEILKGFILAFVHFFALLRLHIVGHDEGS